ncbi:MAG: hypothetical protein FWG64_04690 [Firmicutes bacterium]|nr:hypothetical protein [Bacillota bacterium]
MGINLTKNDNGVGLKLDTFPSDGVFIDGEKLPGVTCFETSTTDRGTTLCLSLLVDRQDFDICDYVI